MKLGRLVGCFFMLIGGGFIALGYSMLNSAGVTFRIFMSGPLFFTLGIAMFVFPGTLTVKDRRSRDLKLVIKEAPLLHKIIWIIAMITGFIIENFLFE